MSTVVSIVLAAVIQVLGITAQEKAHEISSEMKNEKVESFNPISEKDSDCLDTSEKFITIKNRTENHNETNQRK